MKSKKQKRAIEEPIAKRKQVDKRLSTLRSQLTRTENQLTKTEKKLAKARERAEHWKSEAKTQRRSAPGRPAAEATPADSLTEPDETWTVVQLRAEARARGLVGMSNKPKAQLLAALS